MARKTTSPEAKTPVTVTPEPDAGETQLIKKPELLDQGVARTNLKKRDVKPAVEAAFAVIREALQDGAELNLPPLGKIRVVKAKELDGGASVMTVKLRTPKHASFANRSADDADVDG
jgi:nucleoid DNA-binding protein